jgi:hypothetical protein
MYSKIKAQPFREQVTVRKVFRTSTGILAVTDPALYAITTENDLEMKRVGEFSQSHRMAMVHDF